MAPSGFVIRTRKEAHGYVRWTIMILLQRCAPLPPRGVCASPTPLDLPSVGAANSQECFCEPFLLFEFSMLPTGLEWQSRDKLCVSAAQSATAVILYKQRPSSIAILNKIFFVACSTFRCFPASPLVEGQSLIVTDGRT